MRISCEMAPTSTREVAIMESRPAPSRSRRFSEASHTTAASPGPPDVRYVESQTCARKTSPLRRSALHSTFVRRLVVEVAPSVNAITGYTGPADDQRPIISSRSATADIVVGDGEVAVIGGLVKDEETRNVSKIPLLGDIPILGNLFSSTTINHSKSNLMIFIIPHVIYPEGVQPQKPEKYSAD